MKIRKIIALSIVFVILCSSLIVYSKDLGLENISNSDIDITDMSHVLDKNVYTYENYLEDNKNYKLATKDIVLKANTSTFEGGNILDNYDGQSSVAQIGGVGSITWSVDVPEDGFYSLALEYNSKMQTNRTFDLKFLVDGKVPYDQLNYISLSKVWKDLKTNNKLRFPLDKKGNELSPQQEEVLSWQNKNIIDNDGYYADPFLVYIKKGNHSVSVKVDIGDIVISSLTLKAPLILKSYNDIKREYQDRGYKSADNQIIKLQAEQPQSKSDPVLHPIFDRSSAASEPANPDKISLNTIGAANWKYTGQSLSYEFKVKQSGLYKIDMRVRQNMVRGINVSRNIYIDGVIPFKEFKGFQFQFSDNWYIKTLKDKNQVFELYFEKGKTHTITFEVAPSNAEIVRRLQSGVFDLNNIYRDIIMITSTTPDLYRDYMLDRQIPDFVKRISSISTILAKLRKDMNNAGFDAGGQVVIIDQIIRQLDDFSKHPDTIPERIKTFKDNISAAGQWVYTLREQPLELDYFRITSTKIAEPNSRPSFLNGLWYGTRLFISSFFNKADSIANEDPNDATVNVWISQYGRDQALMVKRLVDNDFAKKTGIQVNVNLVQMGLIQATLAGKGPDVAIFMNPQTETINLAARDALQDISKFDGFNDVTKRFHSFSMTPYEYMDKTYGLPVTENFPLMYYRKDIFNTLKLQPPKTWDEFYNAIQVLQRNNLTAGIPSSNALMTATLNDAMFQTLLYQNNGTYYKNGWAKTGFDTPSALSAFKQWTEFYTKYSLPVEFDAFSRFRTGEMPLIIAPYTTYNMFDVAAPEIKGLWDMVEVPGTIGKDGKTNRSVAATCMGISMFKKTINKKGAWEFMKWFTSAEIQGQFAREIESYVGPMARFDTANINAFDQLPWGQLQKDIIKKQWEQGILIPQTPVSYYTNRNISFAFRKVVYSFENPRETLNFYNLDINKEILRKRKQLGIR